MKFHDRFEVTCILLKDDGTIREVASGHPQNEIYGFFTFPATAPQPALNPEVFVKVLDGTSWGGGYIFIQGCMTSLPYKVTTADVITGEARTYGNIEYSADAWPATPPPTTREGDLLLMPISWTTRPFPLSPQGTEDLVERICDFWLYASYGTRNLTHVTAPTWAPGRPLPDECYGSPNWYRECEQAAAAAGYKGKLANVWMSHRVPGCDIANDHIYLSANISGIDVAFAHEVGHKIFGLKHTHQAPGANADIFDPDAMLASWIQAEHEYGSGDIMGSAAVAGSVAPVPLSCYSASRLKFIGAPWQLDPGSTVHLKDIEDFDGYRSTVVYSGGNDRWVYWIDWWEGKGRFRLWMRGPSKSNLDTNSVGLYYLGMQAPGKTFRDVNGTSIYFGGSGKVSVE